MYEYALLPHFCRQLKPLLKKHPSVREALLDLLKNFDTNLYTHLGEDIYKCRLKTPGLRKGKSGAFRVLVLVENNLLTPVAIYFKGDKENLNKKEIRRHLKSILLELRRM